METGITTKLAVVEAGMQTVVHREFMETTRAMNCNNLTDKFASKLVHDQLPTGKRVNKHKPFYEHMCPSCGAEFEDRSHLLLCGDPERVKWRPKLLWKVRNVCARSGVSEELMGLLVDALNC